MTIVLAFVCIAILAVALLGTWLYAVTELSVLHARLTAHIEQLASLKHRVRALEPEEVEA